MLKRLIINNFRQFEHLDLELNADVNILVGDNEAGKSTILQAIEMALTGRIGGRRVSEELSPHWFPIPVSSKYLELTKSGAVAITPRIVIEAYFADLPHLAEYQGNNNSRREDCPGIRFECEFDKSFETQYAEFMQNTTALHSLPVEFYRITRTTFRGDGITGSRQVLQCASIDSSTLRLQTGTDYYLRKTIDEHLSDEIRSRMALALRTYRENLSQDEAFVAANESISAERNTLYKKAIRLAADSSAKSAWESGIVPHLDEVPFGYVGKGEQAAFKTLLALDRETNRSVVLVEEPENHLSYASLHALIERIRERTAAKQLIITTHSSFVLNKLGINHLRLLKNGVVRNLTELSDETRDYFLKLSGYDTLRMVLSRAALLVEGPSDELIVQKAYIQRFGHAPLVDGVDVISVQALAFKRFLELGRMLGSRIAVLTDLDDNDSDDKARKRFEDFEVADQIKGFVGIVGNGRTLEPQLVSAAGGRAVARALSVNYVSDDDLVSFMEKNKTDSALAIFNSAELLTMPDYIESAIAFVQ